MSASSWRNRLDLAPSTAQHIGGFDANPIEQLHARTVQRILKEYPEYSYNRRAEAPVPAKMSSSKKQTMTWDAPTDQKLLLAILAHYGDMKVDYEVLASMMGEHCTPRAVQERIKKLRKDAKAGFDPSSPAMATVATTSGTASPAAKATPARVIKNKKAPAAPKAKRGKKVAKGKAVEEETNDEEELEDDDVMEEEETKEPPRRKRKYMEANAAEAATAKPIGRELAEEMRTAYNEAV